MSTAPSLVLAAIVALCNRGDDVTAWQARLESLRDQYAREGAVERRAAILNSMHELAAQDPASAANHLFWIGQELRKCNRPADAVHAFEVAIQSRALGDAGNAIASFELGGALADQGNLQAAQARWRSIMLDGALDPGIRTLAAEQVRSQAMRQGAWAVLHEIATFQLTEGLGKPPLLLESLARASRAMENWQDAAAAYRTLLDSYPDYLAPNRMIYIEKGYLTCKHEGVRGALPYLLDMIALMDRYQDLARDSATHFAEIYQERYTTATLLEGLSTAYAARGDVCPRPLDELRDLAIQQYMMAIEGLKSLPIELRRNIEFEVVLKNSYLSAIKALAASGRSSDASILMAEMTAALAMEDRDDIPRALGIATRWMANQAPGSTSRTVVGPPAPSTPSETPTKQPSQVEAPTAITLPASDGSGYVAADAGALILLLGLFVVLTAWVAYRHWRGG